MHIEWGTFFISVPTTLVVVGGFGKLFINTFIDNRFKEKLETHKKELQVLIENNKFDLQRKMADFNLYTNRRHEAYMNIYDLLLTADGAIRGLMGFKTQPDFNEYGREDLEKYLMSYNLLDNKVDDFLTRYDNFTHPDQRRELYKEISTYIYMVEIQQANLLLVKARNYFLTKRLYLSEEIIELVSSVCTNLNRYCVDVEFLNQHKIAFHQRADLDSVIEEKFDQIRTQMTKELQIGYYE